MGRSRQQSYGSAETAAYRAALRALETFHKRHPSAISVEGQGSWHRAWPKTSQAWAGTQAPRGGKKQKWRPAPRRGAAQVAKTLAKKRRGARRSGQKAARAQGEGTSRQSEKPIEAKDLDCELAEYFARCDLS